MVLATASSAHTVHQWDGEQALPAGAFDYVVIEEVQSIEGPEPLYYPLLLREEGMIVMIGDQLQTPPHELPIARHDGEAPAFGELAKLLYGTVWGLLRPEPVVLQVILD